ncbi:MAG: hypothetical protein Q7T86_06485 [Hyphomicrobiaceae bacterium]|nr:hypothetical protein [Hyphomicrobiaceae bacterium]
MSRYGCFGSLDGVLSGTAAGAFTSGAGAVVLLLVPDSPELAPVEELSV